MNRYASAKNQLRKTICGKSYGSANHPWRRPSFCTKAPGHTGACGKREDKS